MDSQPREVLTGVADVNVLERLAAQQQQGSLCDVELMVGSSRVPAHRCVLASMSTYFNTMFTRDFRERNQDVIDMSETFASVVKLQDLIDFIYGREITVTEDNVDDYLQCGSLFQIPQLSLLCFKYMVNTLTMKNCLLYWMYAKLYDMKILDDICRKLGSSAFPVTLINLDETLSVPPMYMTQFLNEGLARLCNGKALQSFIDKYCTTHFGMVDSLGSSVGDFVLLSDNVSHEFKENREREAKKSLTGITTNQRVSTDNNSVSIQSLQAECSTEAQVDFDQKSSSQVNTEDTNDNVKKLLVWNMDKFIFYSVSDNKWYVCGLQDKEKEMPGQLGLIGFSTTHSEEKIAFVTKSKYDRDHSRWVDSEHEYYMMGLETLEMTAMPDIVMSDNDRQQALFQDEEAARSTDFRSYDFFCIGEALYAVSVIKVTRIRENDSSDEDSDFQQYEAVWSKVVIDKFEMEARNWRRICTVAKQFSPGETLACVEQVGENLCYIILTTRYELSAYRFDPSDQTVIEENIDWELPYEDYDTDPFVVTSHYEYPCIIVERLNTYFRYCTQTKMWQSIGEKLDGSAEVPQASNWDMDIVSTICVYSDSMLKCFMAKKFGDAYHVMRSVNKRIEVSPMFLNDFSDDHFDLVPRFTRGPRLVYASPAAMSCLHPDKTATDCINKPVLNSKDRQIACSKFEEILKNYDSGAP